MRPKGDEDADRWLNVARRLLLKTEAAGTSKQAKAAMALTSKVDRCLFLLARRPGQQRWLRWSLNLQLNGLEKCVSRDDSLRAASVAAAQLREEARRVCKVADVRLRIRRLLGDRKFLRAGLLEKAGQVSETTVGKAPFRLITWQTIDALGLLPRCGAPGTAFEAPLIVEQVAKQRHLSPEEAEHCIVPFFLSHRWLRTTGPRSEHHPDTPDSVKARCLVIFAQWFQAFAKRKGLHCQVVFWIDWCCSWQDNPEEAELSATCLPLYIASCSKVVTWRTPDFDRRCWLMVERLLCYSFCLGGLTPYVIDETLTNGEASVADTTVADGTPSAADAVALADTLPAAGATLTANAAPARVSSSGADAVVAPSADKCPPVFCYGKRLSCEGQLAAASTVSSTSWQVWLGDHWANFDNENQRSLSVARFNGADIKRIAMGKDTYDVDFARLVQRNNGTGKERPIREVALVTPRVCSVIGVTSNSSARKDTSLFADEQHGGAHVAEQRIHRRATKLPNPLDFEACLVTRASDRRHIAQLVDLALAVPALEVFADRQPVEFGLTEIVEQSMEHRSSLS